MLDVLNVTVSGYQQYQQSPPRNKYLLAIPFLCQPSVILAVSAEEQIPFGEVLLRQPKDLYRERIFHVYRFIVRTISVGPSFG